MKSFLVTVLFIGAILCLLFIKGCNKNYTLFSNDSPLGQYQAKQSQEASISTWQCNNWVGDASAPVTGVSAGLRLVLGETHHFHWDEAEILSAILSFLYLLFPFAIIGAALYKDSNGESL